MTRIAGTNTPQPAATTVVTSVPQEIGIAVSANGNLPALLLMNRLNGVITKVDLGTTPPTLSDIFTGGSRGDFATLGPDGCFYATQTDRVIKVTSADGSCPFAPTSLQPNLRLTPATVIPNPPTGTPVTFTATLRNVTAPAGTTVTFTVTGANPQTKLVPADASGVATFTYTGAHTGADTITATATVGATALTANPVTVTWVAGKDVTFVSLNLSATSGKPNAATTLTASLTDVSQTPPTPIGGATLTISLGSQSCTATTGNDGVGSCTITPTAAPGSYPLVASYAGNSQYTASTATVSFSVTNLVSDQLQYLPAGEARSPARYPRGRDCVRRARYSSHGGADLVSARPVLLPGRRHPRRRSGDRRQRHRRQRQQRHPRRLRHPLSLSGVPLPLTSNLNFVPGTVRPNEFTVALGSDTKFDLYSSSGGDFVIDISGLLRAGRGGRPLLPPPRGPRARVGHPAGATAFVAPERDAHRGPDAHPARLLHRQ